MAVGLFVGTSAWADTKVTFYSNDFSASNSLDLISVSADSYQTLELANDGDSYGNYVKQTTGDRTRDVYMGVTSLLSSNFKDYTDYVVEFDAAFRSGATNRTGGNSLTLKSTGSSDIFKMATPSTQVNAGDLVFTVTGAAEGKEITLTSLTWYHFKFEITSSSVTYTVTLASNGSAVTNGTGTLDITDSRISQVYFGTARNPGQSRFDNLDIYTMTSEKVANQPTFAFSSVSGDNRVYTITNPNGEGTLYYTTVTANEAPAIGDAAYSSTTDASINVSFGTGTYYAYAVLDDGTTTSSIASQSVTGGAVTLNTPVITVSAMTENTGVYNPTYSFSSNQSSILGTPTATLTYSFAGGAATEGTSYTATSTGKLTVTASAEGYTSAQSEITVSKVGFILTDNINVVDFYGDYAGNGNKEWPTGLDYELIPRVTFSPINNTQGCTYRTTHSPNVYNALYARNKAFTATCSGLTEDEIVVFGNYQNNKYAPATSTANTTSVSQDGSIKYYSLYVQPSFTQSITISSAEWKTLCSPYSLDFTDVSGLTAYIVTGSTGSTLNLTAVKKVPARTGILLSGTAKTYTVPAIAESAATDDVSANKLVGVVANKTKDAASIYVLMNETAGVGFYQNNNAFTVGANTAYLPADFAGARAFYLFGDDEVTGVNEVIEVKEVNDDSFYDLQGRCVAQPQKGLYIVNGKKVVIK